MKKSNKLLLGGFLGFLLLIVAVQLTLYANYKNGHYTNYSRKNDWKTYSMQAFPNVKFVIVRDVPNAIAVFSDTAEVDLLEAKSMQYLQIGDSLIISSKNPADLKVGSNVVTFGLPFNATLSVVNSTISLQPGKKFVEGNLVIYLENSRAVITGADNSVKLGDLKIVASEHSTATFETNTMINNLEIQLSNSALDYKDGRLGQLSIITDSLSNISLPSKHLMKAKITTMATQ